MTTSEPGVDAPTKGPSRWALVSTWARRERRSRYRQTWLSAYWALAYPAAMFAIYGWLFSVVLHIRGDGLPYLAFAFAGLVPWTFLAAAATAACPSILQAAPTISSMAFPREVIALGAVGSNVVEALAGLALLTVVAVAQGLNLTVTVIALPAVAGVLLVWVAALSLLLATLTVFFRDLRHVLPFAIQLGFIVTPVMYPTTIIPARFHWVTTVNPFAVVIEATRDVVLRHVWPDWSLLAIMAAVGAIALAAAVAYCRSVELRFADVV